MSTDDDNGPALASAMAVSSLSCSLCHSAFTGDEDGREHEEPHIPLLLSCSHVYCCKCVKSFPRVAEGNSGSGGVVVDADGDGRADNKRVSEGGIDSTDGGVQVLSLVEDGVICHECKAVTLVPRGTPAEALDRVLANIPLLDLMATLRSNHSAASLGKGARCVEDCGRPATCRCITCTEAMCEECFTSIHERSKVLQRHERVGLTPRCPYHNEAFTLWCSTCQLLLCDQCHAGVPATVIPGSGTAATGAHVSLHTNHSCESVDDAAKITTRMLNQRISQLKQEQDRLAIAVVNATSAVTSIDREYHTAARSVSDATDRIITAARKRETALLRELRARASSKVADVERGRRQVSNTCSSMSCIQAEASMLMDCGNQAVMAGRLPMLAAFDRCLQPLTMASSITSMGDAGKTNLGLNLEAVGRIEELIGTAMGTWGGASGVAHTRNKTNGKERLVVNGNASDGLSGGDNVVLDEREYEQDLISVSQRMAVHHHGANDVPSGNTLLRSNTVDAGAYDNGDSYSAYSDTLVSVNGDDRYVDKRVSPRDQDRPAVESTTVGATVDDAAMRAKETVNATRKKAAAVVEAGSRLVGGGDGVFTYTGDFDKCGILYHLATKGLTAAWSNPSFSSSSKGGIVTKRSSDGLGSSADICGRPPAIASSTCSTAAYIDGVDGKAEDAWWAIDLGDDNRIVPTRYTLLASNGEGMVPPRWWQLQASVDGVTWMLLSEHKDDASIQQPGESHTWNIESETISDMPPFRHFSIMATAPDKMGDGSSKRGADLFSESSERALCLSGFELYGVLVSTTTTTT